MNEVISIGIAGQVFWVDIEAHAALKQYLKGIRQQLLHEEFADEIYEDIELRVAELLYGFVNDPRRAVSTAQVHEVIAQIGSVNADDNATPVRSRLGTSNKIVVGVCAGLANRFGIPAFLIRVLFVAAGALFGLGIAAYLILWASMPRARESTRRSAQESSTWFTGQRVLFLPFTVLGLLLDAILAHVRKRRRIYRAMTKNLVAAGLVAATVGVGLGAVELGQARLFPPLITWLLGASAAYLITLVLAIYLREYYAAPPKIRVRPALKRAAWAPAILLAAATGWAIWFQSHQHRETSEHVFTLDHAELRLDFREPDRSEAFAGHVHYRVQVHAEPNVRALVRYSSLGSSQERAESHARAIDYYFAFVDDRLVLDRLWTLPDGVLNRGQEVHVSLFVPDGIVLSSSTPLAIRWENGQPGFITETEDQLQPNAGPSRYFARGSYLHEVDQAFKERLSANEGAALKSLYCATFFVGEHWACESNVEKPTDDNFRFDRAFSEEIERVEQLRQHLQSDRHLSLGALTEMNSVLEPMETAYPAVTPLRRYISQTLSIKSLPPP